MIFKPFSNDEAFTLIEMIIVTALISIMLVVAVPRLHSNIFPDSGDETARWIMATVRQAKQRAVIDRKTYLLNISLDTQQLWMMAADTPDIETMTVPENAYRLPRGVSIDRVALSQADRFSGGTIPIGFYPQGYSDKAVIRIRTRDGDYLTLYIEPFLPRVNLIRGRGGW